MKILTTPAPFLRHKAKKLVNYDKKTQSQVVEMTKILLRTSNPKGVGLAATQVGLDKRLFILNLDDVIHVYINPEFEAVGTKKLSGVYKKKKDRWLEGCLSIPKIWGFVDRYYQIKLKYLSPIKEGSAWKLLVKEDILEDVDAAYAQHETDHLNGILFTDHILKQGGTILQETASGLTPISN